MANLFSENISDKIELSEFKRPKPKQVLPKETKIELKRLNKISSGSVPMFHNEELRKKLFPNNPPKKPIKRGSVNSLGEFKEFVSLKCKAKEPK